MSTYFWVVWCIPHCTWNGCGNPDHFKYPSFTANTKQFCSCHPPWFKDTPHWPSNRHSTADNPTCDSTQTQAEWTAKIWRRLAVERRSKCMSLMTIYTHNIVFCVTTVLKLSCPHCFFWSFRNQRVTSRGRMGLKWSTKPSGPRKCQTECGGHPCPLNRFVLWNRETRRERTVAYVILQFSQTAAMCEIWEMWENDFVTSHCTLKLYRR